ncbi:LOW QUALITY PROTEIN: tyrosine--tRNA ligase, cytoplasmic-like [Octopus sinensis]|uniref:Tyrosine--tRNA ligase n=1 Tax=Octopus sinensis TaxID=2607531 RepID=A0A6P7U1I9_9MOLL|nr:LOW QUALITY PROTEIN: tyrosine--tRNA ligase, cytoplasmic-like [Octopus sinensis]
MVDDLKAQLRYIEDYNELESRRREESTMESLNKASKCKARFSQPEYLEMKKKVKKWRQENEDQWCRKSTYTLRYYFPDDFAFNKKISLITKLFQREVLGEEKIKEIISHRPLKVYWGTATTGKPHIGYFVPLVKIAQLLKAGCQVTILLADLHAVLDNLKAGWDLVNHRVDYYREVISAVMSSLGIPTDDLVFVKGTDYQLDRSSNFDYNRNYVIDMFKMTTLVTQHDARKAGSEVVKQVDYPLLGGLLYPCLQALDEEYLKVDAQFGGVDQRKIFTFAEKYLPQLGCAKRAHLMNPMGHYFPLIIVPGLTGGKMSASDIDSKIDFLDPPKVVQNKIRKAFCMPGSLEDNGVLAFLKMVVFPVLDFKSVKVFSVESPELGTVEYLSYEQVEEDFLSLKLHPADVKAALSREINYLLAPILKAFESPKMQKIVTSAYPGDNKARVVTPTVESVVSDPTVCDFRVGKIISVKKNADSLFVERVDVGGGRILTICSSLVNSCTEEELSGNNFVFLVNLKPANLRGIMSEGMIMCAKGKRDDSEERETFDNLQRELEKLRKYDLLANELSLIHKAKVNIIPVVLTWDGIVSKYFKKYLDSIRVREHLIAYMQSIVLKRTMESTVLDFRRGLSQMDYEARVEEVLSKYEEANGIGDREIAVRRLVEDAYHVFFWMVRNELKLTEVWALG